MLTRKLTQGLMAFAVAFVPVACDDDPVAPEQQPLPNIVETAVDAGSFETLVAAVAAAGLVETLEGEGPFTVFAPTDEAFGNLPEGTVETLLQAENIDQLTDILTYHVAAERLLAEDVLERESIGTVLGQALTISLDDGTPKVNGCTIVQTDIVAENGVIHVIDCVLIPS